MTRCKFVPSTDGETVGGYVAYDDPETDNEDAIEEEDTAEDEEN